MPEQTVQVTARRNAAWLALTMLVILLDLFTKHLATQHLIYGNPEPVLSFFNLTLLHNTGAAFSFLADASGWQRWFFIGLATVVSIGLLIWLLRLGEDERRLAPALALILGGALGNLHDRVVHGYVVDFLHFFYQDWHFPAFNIADSAITVGAFLILVDIWRSPAKKEEANES